MKSYQIANNQEKLSLDECLELGRRCAEGDLAARERLIVSHLYLIDDVLFTFENKGVDTEDLFQEGCYGLLRAVDLYDYKRGVRFNTYAVHWIRKFMRQALRNQSIDRPVVLKDDDFWLLMKVCSVMAHWSQEYGRKPTNEEIAKELNITVEKTTKLLRFSEPFIKIDNSLYQDGNRPIPVPSAEEIFFDNFLCLDDVALTQREKVILFRHLGFSDSKKEEALKEIAASMQLSHETIRLDYRSALQKIKTAFLKHHNNSI